MNDTWTTLSVGALAMAELEQQTRDVLAGDPVTMEIFGWQYAFNLFSHNAPMTDNGYNEASTDFFLFSFLFFKSSAVRCRIQAPRTTRHALRQHVFIKPS